MKKLLISLAILTSLTPTAVLADTGGADQGPPEDPRCFSFVCECYLDGVFNGKEPSANTTTTCTTTCEATRARQAEVATRYGVDPGGTTTSKLQCYDAQGNRVNIDPVATITTPARDPILPCLNVPIAGLKFGNCDAEGNQIGADSTLVVNANGQTTTNLLGAYVEAVYQYLLIAAAIVAVTMLMIAGLQYATARGEAKQVDQAKKRINNAIVGIILLLLAYNIAFVINPATTTFGSLGFATVAQLQLERAASGPEGEYDKYARIYGVSGSWENLSSPYKDLVAQAKKQSSACSIPEGFKSPAGNNMLPNQGPHHWKEGLNSNNYSKVTNLDWAASWGASIYAPFNATSISYTQSTTVNKCGNQINLKSSSGETITICHVKDFIGEGGTKLTGPITQGDVIGHLGGKYCNSGTLPQGWYDQKSKGSTPCNPEVASNCDCQPYAQAGNSTGPHIHVTMRGKSNILACLTP